MDMSFKNPTDFIYFNRKFIPVMFNNAGFGSESVVLLTRNNRQGPNSEEGPHHPFVPKQRAAFVNLDAALLCTSTR